MVSTSKAAVPTSRSSRKSRRNSAQWLGSPIGRHRTDELSALDGIDAIRGNDPVRTARNRVSIGRDPSALTSRPVHFPPLKRIGIDRLDPRDLVRSERREFARAGALREASLILIEELHQ